MEVVLEEEEEEPAELMEAWVLWVEQKVVVEHVEVVPQTQGA